MHPAIRTASAIRLGALVDPPDDDAPAVPGARVRATAWVWRTGATVVERMSDRMAAATLAELRALRAEVRDLRAEVELLHAERGERSGGG